MTLHLSPSRVTSTCNNSSSINIHTRKKIYIFLLQPLSSVCPQIKKKTAPKSKWNSSISVSGAPINISCQVGACTCVGVRVRKRLSVWALCKWKALSSSLWCCVAWSCCCGSVFVAPEDEEEQAPNSKWLRGPHWCWLSRLPSSLHSAPLIALASCPPRYRFPRTQPSTFPLSLCLLLFPIPTARAALSALPGSTCIGAGVSGFEIKRFICLQRMHWPKRRGWSDWHDLHPAASVKTEQLEASRRSPGCCFIKLAEGIHHWGSTRLISVCKEALRGVRGEVHRWFFYSRISKSKPHKSGW